MNYRYHYSSYFIGMGMFKGRALNPKKIAKITIHTNSLFRYLKVYWAMECRHKNILITNGNSYEFR